MRSQNTDRHDSLIVPACLTSQVQHQLPSWTQAAGWFPLSSHVANYEGLCTILSEIEACLNSGPLCALSDDRSISNYLSLGHFLIGETLTQLPANDLTNVKVRSQISQKQEKKFGRFGQVTNTRACSNVVDGWMLHPTYSLVTWSW